MSVYFGRCLARDDDGQCPVQRSRSWFERESSDREQGNPIGTETVKRLFCNAEAFPLRYIRKESVFQGNSV